jgi:hypothetical protein
VQRIAKIKLNSKKADAIALRFPQRALHQAKTVRSSQAATERVQLLRCEYREKVRDIKPENLVFLDEMGLLLGLMRHYARSEKGSRVYDFKPFYRGQKVTVIGAISMDRVLAVMCCCLPNNRRTPNFRTTNENR